MRMKVGICILLAWSSLLSADEWKNLWPDEAPGAKPLPVGSETVGKGQRYTDVEVPQYQLFRPEKSNGQGLVILPGGGYRIVSMEKEGFAIAKWCQARGITAMVVKYRVSGSDEAGYQFPVPQLDARRALRTMRYQAEAWGVDEAKIGVLGASAGGHLAATCATLFEQQLEEQIGDEVDKVSCRPDFAVLLYPVIGMNANWGHEGSRRRLLGENSSEEKRELCAPQLQVTAKTPPTFLVHSADDHVVPLRNSAEFMSACATHKVSVRASIYPTGGHGFGGPGRGAAAGWMDQLEAWLKTL